MFLFFLFFPAVADAELRIEFSNIQESKGSIYIAVYDSPKSFLNPKKVRAQKIVAVGEKGSLQVSLGNFPPGQYAVSSFHDVNGNGRLDTNFLGIPTEPYGFSNNARPKFRAPNWVEAVFDLTEGMSSIGIRLEKW